MPHRTKATEGEDAMSEPSIRTKGRITVEFKAEDVGSDGSFRGYGSVFKVVDSYNEVVDKGAFIQSLSESLAAGRMPKMLWQHDTAQPIGTWSRMEEDDHGLRVEGRLLISDNEKDEIRQAREAYILMKNRVVDGLSIGYRVIEHSYDSETEIVHLKRVALREVSLVTFPANEAALVTAVKSIRQLEGILCDAGISRKDAKALAAHGFGALERRDAGTEGAEDEAILEAVNRLVSKSSMKGI
jgi:HK97 family phage prohead protease